MTASFAPASAPAIASAPACRLLCLVHLHQLPLLQKLLVLLLLLAGQALLLLMLLPVAAAAPPPAALAAAALATAAAAAVGKGSSYVAALQVCLIQLVSQHQQPQACVGVISSLARHQRG
jgi:hypothetical protein